MADLSVKLNRIEKAVDRIRVKVKKPTEAIEEVATAVEQISGSIPDIFKVASIEERDAIEAKENDMCVVHSLDEFYCDGTKYARTLVFPKTIVVDTAITSSIMMYLKYGEANTRIAYQVSKTSFTVRDYGNMAIPYLARYTSTDGITYTRTTNVEEQTYTDDLTAYTDSFNTNITPFMKMRDLVFDGIFTYTNGSWGYTPIGYNVDTDLIVSGTNIYTDNGNEIGTLFDSAGQKLYELLKAKFYDRLEEITSQTTNLSYLFRDGCINPIYANSINTDNCTNMSGMFYNSGLKGEVILENYNTNNVTKLSSLFLSNPNITKITLSNFDTSKVTDMRQMFDACTNLTELDLSTFTSEAKPNILYMFRNATSLKKIDIRNFDFTYFSDTPITSVLENVPTNCLIIVKDTTQKSWFATKFSSYTNVKTVAEYGG